jgi:hypothetical protein
VNPIGSSPQEAVGPGTAVRRTRHAAIAAAMVWFIALSAAPAVVAEPIVTYKCTPAPDDCTGWYRSDVLVDWTVVPADDIVEGCIDETLTSDGENITRNCLADDGSAAVGKTVRIDLDKTPPIVTGGWPARGADTNGWYNHAVSVEFRGSDLTSEVASCTTTTYGGPDSTSASLEGTCVDNAGNVSDPFSFGVKYDETEPSVTAAVTDRPPDHGTWFTSPVRLAVVATDATSGLAECPAVTYGGPDSASVSVTGTCRDRAGNTASRTFALSFDATPPVLTRLSASAGDRRVMLRWNATAGATSVQIMRSPGIAGASTSVVFRGAGDGFVDSQVVNGDRYAYEIRVIDAAGNASSRTVRTVPGPRLIAPAAGAVVNSRKPPVLRWTTVRGARYYNVQLFRDGRKVLSAWPAQARLKLKHRWRYGGRRLRFVAGEYKWLVWPGRGARSKAEYGERIGVRKFTVHVTH